MRHALSSVQTLWLVPWPLGSSQVLLFAVLLLGGSMASAADPPAKEKSDAKESRAQFRSYLPAIRCKALLENERRSVAEVKKCHELYSAYLEGGLIFQVEVTQIEAEVLRGRIRILRRDRDYGDALDLFTHRFTVPAERRRQMQEATISPLGNLFQRFEELTHDKEEAWHEALKASRIEDVAKLRPILVKLLTTSALVKDTALPKRFRKEWAEWEKIKSIDEISEKLRKDQRLKERYPARDIGSLEFYLRIYERQPWKTMLKEPARQQASANAAFRSVAAYFRAVSGDAYTERSGRLCRSWPALPSTRLKEVNLITCDDDKAEQIVMSLLKTSDAQLAGKKKVRQLRTLAKSYPLEQRLFDRAFLRWDYIMEAQQFPTTPPAADQSGLPGPVALLPPLDKTAFEASSVIDTLRSLSQSRRQLLQTWIDYQMIRLDLYDDLALSPPDH